MVRFISTFLIYGCRTDDLSAEESAGEKVNQNNSSCIAYNLFLNAGNTFPALAEFAQSFTGVIFVRVLRAIKVASVVHPRRLPGAALVPSRGLVAVGHRSALL